MDSYEVGKRIRLPGGRRVSDRTVRTWFKELQKGCFDYYPEIKFERLGLVPTVILIDNLKDSRLSQAVPFCDYVSYNLDPARWKEVMLLRYQVPAEALGKFRQFWTKARKSGLVDSFEILNLSTPATIYSPHHKVMKRDGSLDFSDVGPKDYRYFLDPLEHRVQSRLKAEIHPVIRKNPFIVPVLFEYFREHWSSRQVWDCVKNKLGDRAWGYLRRVRKRTDGVGISRVQQTVKLILEKHYEDFFEQVRVIYNPFYLGQNILTFLIVDFEDRDQLLGFSRALAQRSLITGVHLNSSPRSNRTMFHFLTSQLELRRVLSHLTSEFVKQSSSNRILWKNEDKSIGRWSRDQVKIDYAKLFDPKECTWNYDHNNYAAKLEELPAQATNQAKWR